MAHKALDVYLNDHLGGASLGTELSAQIRKQAEGTPLGDVMVTLVAQIDEDQETLLDVMHRLDVTRNPVKQVGGWLGEKVTRVKFSGASSGQADHGMFMALEAMSLGVQGKAVMWRALRAVRDGHPALEGIDFDALIARADEQYATLERERLEAAKLALAPD